MEDFDFQWAIDIVNSILPDGKVRVLAYDYGNSAAIAWEIPEGEKIFYAIKMD